MALRVDHVIGKFIVYGGCRGKAAADRRFSKPRASSWRPNSSLGFCRTRTAPSRGGLRAPAGGKRRGGGARRDRRRDTHRRPRRPCRPSARVAGREGERGQAGGCRCCRPVSRRWPCLGGPVRQRCARGASRGRPRGVGQKGGGSSTRTGASRFWGPCSVSGSTA